MIRMIKLVFRLVKGLMKIMQMGKNEKGNKILLNESQTEKRSKQYGSRHDRR